SVQPVPVMPFRQGHWLARTMMFPRALPRVPTLKIADKSGKVAKIMRRAIILVASMPLLSVAMGCCCTKACLAPEKDCGHVAGRCDCVPPRDPCHKYGVATPYGVAAPYGAATPPVPPAPVAPVQHIAV